MNRRLGALSRVAVVALIAALALAAGLAGGGGSASAQTLNDYDDDDDGLIDIRSLAQLNAVRHNLLGFQTSTHADWVAAFPSPASRMGCPHLCLGYELRADLDFDTDADGDVDSDDDFPNWTPIGSSCETFQKFQAVFEGNGHTISNLKIDTSAQYAGLFGVIAVDFYGTANISGLGLLDVDITSSHSPADGHWAHAGALAGDSCGGVQARVDGVYATGSVSYTGGVRAYIGGLLGANSGALSASWANVNVSANGGGDRAGGLVGRNSGATTAAYAAGSVSATGNGVRIGGFAGVNWAPITAAYAAGSVSATGNSSRVGGFIGLIRGGAITATYAAGSVSATGNSSFVGGFVGQTFGTDFSFHASYWDSTATGIADDADSNMPEGKSTSDLKSPAGYSGVYADWNVDLDGAPGVDDPWDFGFSTDYPALKFGGMDLPTQFASAGDYDRDDDGLIEIYDLDMLNAVRWDLDGDAVQDSTSGADWTKYGAAFPDAIAANGCPDTAADADSLPGPCGGYELALDLDFDEDGSGFVESPGDAYPNWTPIGDATTGFSASFDGNGKTVSNLTIDSAAAAVGLFGGVVGSAASVSGVGLLDANVTASAASAKAGALIGVLSGSGAAARAAFATGGLSASGNSARVGGLIGEHGGGTVAASWADVNVSASGTGAEAGGLAGRSTGTTLAAYAAGSVAVSGTGSYAGGLTGRLVGGTIRYAYAVGAVSKAETGGGVGGLTGGLSGSTTIAAGYWDTATTGQADDAGSAPPEGLTTDALQSPVGYTGVYATWNANVDGQAGNDDPWDFGTAANYPALKFGVQKPDGQREDYDRDDDGLIEISTLAQLNAIRWDVDGDAVQDSTSAADWKKHGAAFFDAQAGLGCPDTDDADALPGPCGGFELAAHLDFDTDGDGATYTGTGASANGDSGDDYYNGGSGWEPLGQGAGDATSFSTTFEGNGYTISNLFIKRTSRRYNTGLFGRTTSNARIESVAVLDAYVYGQRYVGVLVGSLAGPVSACYVSGEVLAERQAGGLVGYVANSYKGYITASRSDANVSQQGSPGSQMGGLVGYLGISMHVYDSYSTGTVTTTGANRGGLIGSMDSSAHVSASYWDTTTSGIADDSDSDMPEGKTTSELQSPVGYTGIYADWSVNQSFGLRYDVPWDFGNSGEYPALVFGGMDPVIQRGDYDRDDDGKIEIYNLDQLNAVRWDLDGDAVQDATSNADWKKYNAAFFNAKPSLGCADTNSDSTPGPCAGYELARDLDFDANGDGKVTSDDPYPNWTPIGSTTARFNSDFEGNGYVISNMKIEMAGGSAAGLFGATDRSAEVSGVGMLNADVSVTGSANFTTYAGALIGTHAGVARRAFATGSVSQTGSGTNGFYGGLIGYFDPGSAYASWADVDVSATAASASVGGFVGRVSNGASVIAASAAGDVSASGASANVGGFAGALYGSASVVYATGAVSKTGSGGGQGGIAGATSSSTSVSHSYWDIETTNIPDDADGDSPEGKTTDDLQSVPGYAGIYSGWNANVDGAPGNDDPWDFGFSSEYPALKFGGMDPYIRRGDYDRDDDGLIEITTLDRLNAVRWDLDGDGERGITSAPEWAKYKTAFANAAAGMGCPDTLDVDAGPGPCAGFELAAHLDFDSNGDGVVDSEDAYHNWTPIGSLGAHFEFFAVFEGNYKTVSNLTINSAARDVGLFGAIGASGENSSPTLTPSADGSSITITHGSDSPSIRRLGVTDAAVTAFAESARAGALLGASYGGGLNRGGLYATGSVSAKGSSAEVGGLAGRLSTTAMSGGWADVAVSASGDSSRVGGFVGYSELGETLVAAAIGPVSSTGDDSEVGGFAGKGKNWRSTGVYALGAVTKSGRGGAVGGLAGIAQDVTILATYSASSVSSTGDNVDAGGFAGEIIGATVNSAYAAGAVTKSGTGGSLGGFMGEVDAVSTFSAAYWDAEATGIADDADADMPEGKTTNYMQASTSYASYAGTPAGLFTDWNIDVTHLYSGSDDPWDFGDADEYPTLRYRHGPEFPYYAQAHESHHQRGDYDRDDDGLIEIHDVDALNAVRWDLDGDGEQDSASAAEWAKYKRAFRNAADGMGCPDSDSDSSPGPCAGYELAADLDFDTNADGRADFNDAYPNWTPIGDSANPYSAAFDFGGKTVSNLTISSDAADVGMFGGIGGSASVTRAALRNASVTATAAANAGLLAGVLNGAGAALRYGYATGSVSHTAVSGGFVGGLVGAHSAGTVAAVWADASVSSAGAASRAGGLVGDSGGGTITAAYAAGSVSTTGAAAYAGGFAGRVSGGEISAAYAAGAVTKSGTGGASGGFAGDFASGSVASAYWDSQTTTIADDANAAMPEGKTTAQLKSPTGYAGIYRHWNANSDGAGGGDDPWTFGGASDYPALNAGGMEPHMQHGDYDQDDDGLIEIYDVDMLNAVRWDLDGDAVQDSTSDADWKKHGAPFFNAKASLGCPDTAADPDSLPGPCVGYELARNLDFDTDGDGDVDFDDAYPRWTPMGSGGNSGSRYAAAFDGNGKTISNLTINDDAIYAGLFGGITSGASITRLGLLDASVTTTGTGTHAGALAGIMSASGGGAVRYTYATGNVSHTATVGGSDVGGLIGEYRSGTVAACWSDVDVSSAGRNSRVGGLIGGSRGTVIASYAAGVVTATGDNADVGGLIGEAERGTITASYASGAVWNRGTGGSRGGLVGDMDSSASSTDSYWDSTRTGVADDADADSPEGRATSVLQSPTAYGTGIYANWNVNVDGVSGGDDPWDFGDAGDFPALKSGGMESRIQNGDYDEDDDGLIEIHDLDALNAIRWDADGNGASFLIYRAAFPRAFSKRAMGCADTDSDSNPGPCVGYELAQNLDFDTDGDGDVDIVDAYPNWTPIDAAPGHSQTDPFSAKFDGNNNTISNLRISRTANSDNVGLFGRSGATAVITGVALRNAEITSSGSGTSLYIGALVGSHAGTLRSSYSTGFVFQMGTGTGAYVGGLTGDMPSGSTIAASWSGAHVSAAAASANAGGLTGRLNGGTITAAYATGAVSASGASAYAGGLGGVLHAGTLSASYATGPSTAAGTGGTAAGMGSQITGSNPTITVAYWDVGTTGIADDMDMDMPEGKTTNELQGITDAYERLYSTWNANVDGQSGNDDPWNLGTWMQYPMLKYDGMSLVAQGSLAMGMASPTLNHSVVGEAAGVCLVDGPAMRAGAAGSKAPWQWQRSPDGITWTDIAEDGGSTWMYTAASADLNNYLRACVALGDTAPEGATEACVHMFGKTQN